MYGLECDTFPPTVVPAADILGPVTHQDYSEAHSRKGEGQV